MTSIKINFEHLDIVETKDLKGTRAFVKNNPKRKLFCFVKGFIDKKYYLHCVDSSGYQFVLSKDQTHKKRKSEFKTFTKISQIYDVATNVIFASIIVDLKGSEAFYLYENYTLIVTQNDVSFATNSD
jgi:hypothetical protein